MRIVKLADDNAISAVLARSEMGLRTQANSAGTVKVLADGSGGPEHSEEVFILGKADSGDWKSGAIAFLPPVHHATDAAIQ